MNRLFLIFALAVLPAAASADNGLFSATPVSYHNGQFTPTHVYAWKTAGKSPATTVFFTEREVPADAWIDSTDRHRALTKVLVDAEAPHAVWRILDEGNTPDSIMNCGPDGMCMSFGGNVINDVAMERSTLKVEGNRLRGKVETGSGVCSAGDGYAWCDVATSLEVDVELAPPGLIERIATQGNSAGPEATAVKKALTDYWKAAGKAKKFADIDRFLTAEQRAENAAQGERFGAEADEMVAMFFAPMHAGKLDITSVKTLDDSAVADIKTRTTGEWADDMACTVLLHKEDGAWKVGKEDC